MHNVQLKDERRGRREWERRYVSKCVSIITDTDMKKIPAINGACHLGVNDAFELYDRHNDGSKH